MPESNCLQNVAAERLDLFCREALARVGVSTEHSRLTADVLVTTDSWGVFTHGSKLLGGYLNRLKSGGLRTDAEPGVAAEGPAWAIVDGHSVLGQVTSTFAMKKAIELARGAGVAYVGVRNSCHFGAAGYYTSLAAKEGMVGLAMANDRPSVAAPGSRGAIIGTNPFSYAVPAGEHDPILLDMAISTVAGGKVYAAHQRGEAIAADWIIGPDGLPTTDGSLYPEKASLAPMSAHKGYGLGLMIESLSAALSGAAMTWSVGSWIFGDASKPTDHGAAFLAMNVAAMGSLEAFQGRIDALIREIHAAPRAHGVDRLYVPGEMEWERRRAALRDGIPLPADVRAALVEVGTGFDIALPWS